jgi:hypothetical protein
VQIESRAVEQILPALAQRYRRADGSGLPDSYPTLSGAGFDPEDQVEIEGSPAGASTTAHPFEVITQTFVEDRIRPRLARLPKQATKAVHQDDRALITTDDPATPPARPYGRQ